METNATNSFVYYGGSNGYGTTIFGTSSGGLQCDDCSKAWCEHIQGAILLNLDADQVWGRVAEARSSFVEVPLRPSSGITPMVSFDPVHGNKDAYRVNLMGWLARFDEHGLTKFIGFLNKGEGRRHLREMMINWFAPAVELSKLECFSARHNWPVRAKMSEDFVDNNHAKMLDHAWLCIFRRQCAYCNAHPGDFDPDLIPGV